MLRLSAGVPRALIRQDLEQSQRIRERMLGPTPPGDRKVSGKLGGRHEHVRPTAVPPQSRMLIHRLGMAVQLTGPPLVLVLRRTARRREEEHPVAAGLGDGADVDAGGEQPLQGLAAGVQGYVEYV